jgi:hypothetical protein
MSNIRVPYDLDVELFADLLETLSSDYSSGDALFTGAEFNLSTDVEEKNEYSLTVDFHLTHDADVEEELARLVDPDGQSDD